MGWITGPMERCMHPDDRTSSPSRIPDDEDEDEDSTARQFLLDTFLFSWKLQNGRLGPGDHSDGAVRAAEPGAAVADSREEQGH
ncbi:hypothetical protein CRG98_036250 [Punica granatum]|uniref:Uncharacterized protein n=1 Tax=Punica granatum TaxID=22663 RepID=A0A2I0IH89_PUNGR|nr:hypothetical protein CRG98_036250 [Punica granatum]